MSVIEPRDRPELWETTRHEVLGRGRVSDFVEDDIVSPSGETFTRQYVTHPGAVGVMALDEQGRVAVVSQYRHPVAMRLVEPPAGLLDHAGEDVLKAAKRELAEEAKLRADDWRTLIDIVTTPGGCAETIRIFLARGLHATDRPEGFVVEHEEAHMPIGWVALSELVDAIFRGEIESPSMVSGTLALHAAITDGRVDALRPADAPWPARDIWERRTAAESVEFGPGD